MQERIPPHRRTGRASHYAYRRFNRQTLAAGIKGVNVDDDVGGRERLFNQVFETVGEIVGFHDGPFTGDNDMQVNVANRARASGSEAMVSEHLSFLVQHRSHLGHFLVGQPYINQIVEGLPCKLPCTVTHPHCEAKGEHRIGPRDTGGRHDKQSSQNSRARHGINHKVLGIRLERKGVRCPSNSTDVASGEKCAHRTSCHDDHTEIKLGDRLGLNQPSDRFVYDVDHDSEEKD